MSLGSETGGSNQVEWGRPECAVLPQDDGHLLGTEEADFGRAPKMPGTWAHVLRVIGLNPFRARSA